MQLICLSDLITKAVVVVQIDFLVFQFWPSERGNEWATFSACTHTKIKKNILFICLIFILFFFFWRRWLFKSKTEIDRTHHKRILKMNRTKSEMEWKNISQRIQENIRSVPRISREIKNLVKENFYQRPTSQNLLV